MDTEQQKLLEVNDLKMHFPVVDGALFRRTVGWVKAVDGVSSVSYTHLPSPRD